jgi:CheY-like chemotaxis protein
MTLLPYDARPLRILLADDEDCILFVLGELLRADGHTVGTAPNGAEALEQFKDGEWDVVLTDRVMPAMDGEALAGEIKKLSPQTPVIMVTGFAPEECAHVDAIVRKPFTRATIADAISKCMIEAEERAAA